MQDKLVTLRQIAEIIGCSRSQIYNLASTARDFPHKKKAFPKKYSLLEVMRWHERQENAMKIRELAIKFGVPIRKLKHYVTHPSFPSPAPDRIPKQYDPDEVKKWLDEKPQQLVWNESDKYSETCLTINEICMKLGLKQSLFRYYERQSDFPEVKIKQVPRRYDIEEIEQWLDTYHGKRLYDNEEIIEFKNPTLSIKFLAGHFDPKYKRRRRLTTGYNPAKTKVVRLRTVTW